MTDALGLDDHAIAPLREAMRGPVITPRDGAAYDAARALYNAMFDKHPGIIARCRDAADVVAAVRFGRERGLDIAVRAGGHNGAGLASVDGGLVIDLRELAGVRVDPASGLVDVAGGSLLGDVDHATHAFGRAVPGGIVSTTGVAGLTLGGGMGHLTRRYGLSIDALRSADIVLADGRLVTASAIEHPDLFWALRGGGGNFGVVTRFGFAAVPVSTIVGGPTLWPIEQAPEVLQFYREFLPSAPRELTGFFAFLTVPPAPPFPEELHLRKVCGIVWCSTAGEDETARLLEPLHGIGSLVLYGVQPMPLPMLQSAFDGLYPPGHQWYWRSDFVADIPDNAIGRHLEWGMRMPTMQSSMHLYPIDGAAADVGPSDTAWAYRDAAFSQVIVGVDPDPAKRDELREWAVGYWEALHAYSMGGAYVNFMMDEGGERIRATYRHNYDRLAAVKAAYDPDNTFHVNQNVAPQAHIAAPREPAAAERGAAGRRPQQPAT